MFESSGKVLDFETSQPGTGEKNAINGRILRSGYVPHISALQRPGQHARTIESGP